ncbi:hypothetical protein A9Q84_16170 [Halobacteriovorax marinus]|uniref:Acyltransferase 3 domain-containing protein n=1 Tax=Halobacteriovorax marinus TaxID=97084 RepID=A0A1Y5F853_9BACT|nr:hypothetical protein A9Q84_16170 [Halobacteriovorax marinus]
MSDIQVKETKPSYRNKALDGLRGLGCLLVLIGHTQWNSVTILPGAVIAMDIFFVLSGFLITGLIINEKDKTGSIELIRFWKRRAIRLFPAFYVYFAIGATIFFASGFQPIVGTDSVVTLLSTAFYGSNWAVGQGYNLGIFAVTWSLSLEEQFYFLCPLFFLFSFKYFSKKTTMYILIALIIGVNIHRYQLFHSLMESKGIMLAWKRCFYGLDTRGDSLLVGCLSALFLKLYGDKIRIGPKLGMTSMVLILLCLLIRDLPVAYHIAENSFYTEFLMTGGFTVFSLVGVMVIIHLVQFPNSLLSKLLSPKWLVRVGIMSYSIYLWHTTVFGGIEVLLKSFNRTPALWALKTFIRFSVAFIIAYFSFRFVEGPILKSLAKKRNFAPIPKESETKHIISTTEETT